MMKAQADIVYFMGTAFGAAIAIVLLIYVFGQLFGGLKANPQVAAVPQAVNALNSGAQAQTVMANALVIVYIFVMIGSILLSFFVDSSPIFLIVIFVALPAEMLLAFVLHDAFFQIMQSSFLSGTIVTFPILTTFFSFLPVIVLALCVITSIITFTKR